MAKFKDVYDNVKHKTPMKRMLEAQEAVRKAKEAAQPKTSTRKTKED